MQTVATHQLSYMYSGRIVSGLGVGLMSTVVRISCFSSGPHIIDLTSKEDLTSSLPPFFDIQCPTYVSEMAPKNVRGRITGMFQIVVVIGVAFSYWIEYGISVSPMKHSSASWRIVCPPMFFSAIALLLPRAAGHLTPPFLRLKISSQPIGFQIAPSGLMILLLPLIKESPRWLVSRGRTDEALANLAWVRKRDTEDPRVLEEFAEITAAHQDEIDNTAGTSWKECLAPGMKVSVLSSFARRLHSKRAH